VAVTYPTGNAYKSPAASAKAPAAMAGGPASTTLPAVDIGWRDFLTDPRLQRLVQIAADQQSGLAGGRVDRRADAGAIPDPARDALSDPERIHRFVDRAHTRQYFELRPYAVDARLYGRSVRLLGDRFSSAACSP